MNTNITFECLGDPGFYYDDESDVKAKANDDDQIKFYTLDKLPGNELMIRIKQDCTEYNMGISTDCITKEQFQNLVSAQLNNSKYSINVCPGSNQNAGISTSDGYTHFDQFGAGGDSPASSNFKLPNNLCVDQFKRLIDY